MPPRHNGSAKSVDATLKRVAEQYKLSDMGQRGGTRPGEIVKQVRQQETPERYVNVQGIPVPVTNGITSTWSQPTTAHKVSVGKGAPYAGLKPAGKIPTNVAFEHKG